MVPPPPKPVVWPQVVPPRGSVVPPMTTAELTAEFGLPWSPAPPQPQSVRLPVVPLGKVVVYGALVVGAVYIISLVLSPKSGGSVAQLHPAGVQGLGMLPTGLVGLGGYLLLSKMLRGEIKGWSEAIKQITKAIDDWGK